MDLTIVAVYTICVFFNIAGVEPFSFRFLLVLWRNHELGIASTADIAKFRH